MHSPLTEGFIPQASLGALSLDFGNQSILVDTTQPSIFLAGPTNRGGRTEWRLRALEYLCEFDGIVYIPEYDAGDFDVNRVYEQYTWEQTCLKACSCILFWIPRSKEMPALTTNIEVGMYLQRSPEKIVYSHPENAEHMRYLDWLWKQEHGGEIHANLSDACNAALELA